MNNDIIPNEDLQYRVNQAEAMLKALHQGEVDLMIGAEGPMVIRLRSLFEEKERLRILLDIVRRIGRLIIHEDDTEKLLESAVDSFCEGGLFHGVRILQLDDSAATIQSVVSKDVGCKSSKGILAAGRDFPYLAEILESPGPMIMTGLNGELENCCCIGVPLVHEGEVFGALSVLAPQSMGKDEGAHQLCAEIGEDLGYALYRIRDIMKHKQEEEQLRQYKYVMSSSSDMLALLDKRYKYLTVNQAYLDAFALTHEELIGKTALEVSGKEFFNTVIKPYADQCLGGEEVKYSDWFNLSGRGRCYMAITYFPYYQNDKIIGFAVNGRDITKTKQAETEREQLKTAIEQSDESFVVTDPEGIIQFVNRGFEKETGYSREEVIGLRPNILKSGEQDEAFYNKMWSKLTNGQPFQGRMVNKRKDGTLYTEIGTISPVFDINNKIINYIAVKRDVTEYLRLESKLLQSQKMESIGMLAGGIAHDFNNILSVILGYTELALNIAEKATPLEVDLQQVYRAGIRASELVKQILTFARQTDEKCKPIQVDFIIKEVVKFIRSSLPTTIEIKQNIESNFCIMGNSTQVHQIMMNLCTNAAHAMGDESGTLEITLKDITIARTTNQARRKLKFGNYVELKVSDTGTGIEPHIIGKIFDPYFTTKKPGEGTGMGLALVHGIVETYGGELTVDSTLGKGTVFTLCLPIAEEKCAPLAYKSIVLPTGQERILYVDDEPSIVKIASRILGQLGYSVTTKTCSVEALEIFRSKPDDYDLVISDVTMPQMTGDQLTRKLLEIRPDIPVILCTGYTNRLSKVKASEIGVKAFATKPISKEDLAKTVRRVLDEAKVIKSTETS